MIHDHHLLPDVPTILLHFSSRCTQKAWTLFEYLEILLTAFCSNELSICRLNPGICRYVLKGLWSLRFLFWKHQILGVSRCWKSDNRWRDLCCVMGQLSNFTFPVWRHFNAGRRKYERIFQHENGRDNSKNLYSLVGAKIFRDPRNMAKSNIE